MDSSQPAPSPTSIYCFLVPRRAAAPMSSAIHCFPLILSDSDGRSRNQPPLISTSPEALLESLAAEYVYAQLCEAAMHAFVAENEARMLAMLAARNNIETKLGLLTRRERQLRQQEITTEVVELAAGAEASQANHH